MNNTLPNTKNGPNGWDQWSKHVLTELGRLSDNAEKTCCSLADLHVALARIETEIKVRLETEVKIKSTLWGVFGGVIPVIVLIVIKILE